MSNTPLPGGEYAVGTTTYTVYGERNVSVRVYYPVLKESVEGMEKTRYLSRDMVKALGKTFHVPMNYDKSEADGSNRSECYTEAPRIGGKKFPAIVFGHGLSSYREGSSFLCIELASNGYVVLAPGFQDAGVLTEFDDGTSAPFNRTLSKKMYDPYLGGVIKLSKLMKQKGTDRELAEKFDQFQKEYCKVLIGKVKDCEQDVLAVVSYAKENLSDLIDFDCGIAAAGHSLGGVTAYALCLDHPDFVCGINLDGASYGDNTGKILEKPFLQVCCKDNESVETRMLIDHKSTVYKASFKDMKHVGFADLKFMIPVKAISGKLPAEVLHENLCRCSLEFLDAYLKKTKDKPSFKSNDAVTYTEYEPDVK